MLCIYVSIFKYINICLGLSPSRIQKVAPGKVTSPSISPSWPPVSVTRHCLSTPIPKPVVPSSPTLGILIARHLFVSS